MKIKVWKRSCASTHFSLAGLSTPTFHCNQASQQRDKHLSVTPFLHSSEHWVRISWSHSGKIWDLDFSICGLLWSGEMQACLASEKITTLWPSSAPCEFLVLEVGVKTSVNSKVCLGLSMDLLIPTLCKYIQENLRGGWNGGETSAWWGSPCPGSLNHNTV